MPNPNLSILLANDDPQANQAISALLVQAGYRNIRHSGLDQALGLLQQQPASLLLVGGPSSLAVASQVRQHDELTDHYTYVLLLSTCAAAEVLDETADNGIDDIVDPNHLSTALLPRAYAADRLCSTLQRARQENRLLRQNIAQLQRRNQVDALTGLGNARYLRQKLGESLRQVQARGGAICYLLIGIEAIDTLQDNYEPEIYDQVLQGVARRLQQMVRPLDVLARLDDEHFVLLTLPADLQECAPSSFKRLHDGLNLKGFMTDEGVLEVSVGISLIGLDSRSLPIEPKVLLDEASRLLKDAYASGLVTAKRMPAKRA